MSTIKWANAVSGDFGNNLDWKGGNVPGPADDAVIDTTGAYSVSVTMAEAVRSLTLNDPGATLSINSGGTLTLGTTLTAMAGMVQLNSGGEISGGTLSASGGAFLWAGGALDGVTYEGTLDISAPTSASVYVTSKGLILEGAGGVGNGAVDLTAYNASLNLEGTQTLDTATIDIGSNIGDSILNEDDVGSKGGQVLTLGAGLTIDHTGTYAEITGSGTAGDEVVNKGTINATLSGGQFIIGPLDFINSGAITVSGGDTLFLQPTSFDNSAGTITVAAGSTLDLRGALTTAEMGSLTSSGAVVLTNTLTNTGVLSVGKGAPIQTFTLSSGGEITGGTISDGGSGMVWAGGALDGVTYEGTLDISAPTSASVYVTSKGLILEGAGGVGNGAVDLTAYNASLNLEGTQTLDTATIDIGSNIGDSILNEDDVGSKGGQVLTLGAGLTIDHTGTYAEITGSGTAGDEVVNKGTINATLSGGQFIIGPLDFINSGAITVSGGDTLFLQPTSFDNSAGTITVAAGSTLDLRGALTTAEMGSLTSSGAVVLTNTLTNTGVLSVGKGAPIQTFTLSSGGEITGGTISDGGSGMVWAGGALDGVTYEGTLDISAPTSASVYVTSKGLILEGAGGVGNGAVDLTAYNASLNLEGTQTLDTATIDIGSNIGDSILNEDDVGSKGGQVLTLGAGLTIDHTGTYAEITGSGTAGDEVVNKGTINATLSGGQFIIGPLDFINSGAITVSGGDTLFLQPTSFDNSAGTITVAAGSTLDLRGALTTAEMGSLTSSGAVVLTNTLTNTGVLSVGKGAPIQTFTLSSGGEITGGTISDGGSGMVWAGGALDGVTYEGTLDISAPTSASVYVTSKGLILEGAGGVGNGAVDLTAYNASLNLEGTQTLDKATIDIGSNIGDSILNEDDVGSKGGQVLTLGAGLTIDHTGTYAEITGSGTAGDEVVNKGTINATLSGGQFRINPLAFVNEGLIAVSGGDTVYLYPTSFDNSAGTVTVDATSTLNIQVNLTTAQLGSVTSTGSVALSSATLTNSGKVFQVGKGAPIQTFTLSSGGEITGGTISDGGSGIVGAGGTLDGVTYEGTLDLSAPTSASVYVTSKGMTLKGSGGSGPGTVNLTGYNASLNLEGTQTLDAATIDIGSNIGYSILNEDDVGSKGGQVLTLGPSLTIDHTGTYAEITGTATAGDEVINKGTINASLKSGQFVINPRAFVNDGKIIISGGDTVVASTILNSAVGTLSVGMGSTLDLTNAAVLEIQGSLVNAGTIAIQSGGKTTDLRVLGKGLTLSGGGTVALSGQFARILGQSSAATLFNVDNTITGSGYVGATVLTMVNEAAGVIKATARDLVVRTSGKTFTNSGLMEGASGGQLDIVATTVDQTGGGTITALAGGRVNLEAAVVEGGQLAGTGVLFASLTGNVLDGRAQAIGLTGALGVFNGANLTIEGSIANAGRIDLWANTSRTDLIVGSAGATFTGHGEVNLDNRTLNRIYGASSSATLTNVDNRIAGGGLLGNGVLDLVNEASGSIVGNTSAGLVIDTGANAVVNAGEIFAITGTVTVKSAVANTGTLFAAGGTIVLDGAVSGNGKGEINGGTLDAAAAFGENVAFVGATGVLELADSQAYGGTVSGFSLTGKTSFDLLDIGDNDGKAVATYKDNGKKTGGVLTVTDSLGHTATINLVGNYSASTFTTTSDSHNGTTVVAQTASAVFASAMAGFGAASSAPFTSGGEHGETLAHMIAVPRGPRMAAA